MMYDESMSKSKGTQDKRLKRIAREQELATNHVGVMNRAQTFKNRKREASRSACRKGNWA